MNTVICVLGIVAIVVLVIIGILAVGVYALLRDLKSIVSAIRFQIVRPIEHKSYSSYYTNPGNANDYRRLSVAIECLTDELMRTNDAIDIEKEEMKHE